MTFWLFVDFSAGMIVGLVAGEVGDRIDQRVWRKLGRRHLP